MDFSVPTDLDEFRQKVRTFLAENFPDELRARRFERPHDKAFYLAVSRFQRENLADRNPSEVSAFNEEVAQAGVDLLTYIPTRLIAETLQDIGTPRQKAEDVPRMLGGEYLVALGLTEPDSGSDVAAARTRAVSDGQGGWIINGQKMYTSNAQHATHIFLLTRTNLDVPKRQGLTVFLVPVNSPGLEVRKLHTLTYHGTNMTYYTDVPVSDECRIGEVDGGWDVMRVALGREQGGEGSTDLHEVVRQAFLWAQTAQDDEGRPRTNNAVVRERLARAAVDLEVTNLLIQRAAWASANHISKEPGWGPGAKLFETEAYARVSADLFDLVGPAAVIPFEESGTVAGGWFNYCLRDSPQRIIAGGASEVMRDIIAERRLGLPRARPS
jgi:alkylation response protein AidB-like acyl-CoA dehydrogenase